MMEKAHIEVESSISRIRWRQMVEPQCYNYKVLVCYVLLESNEFFKRMEAHFGDWRMYGM